VAASAGISALVGMAIPIGILVGYTYATTGLTNPATRRSTGSVIFYPELGYHRDWAIQDPRYLVQNLPLLIAGCRTSCRRALRAPSADSSIRPARSRRRRMSG
jgi:hypothetical protein